MTDHQAVEALRADRDVVLDLASRLSDEEWDAESGCPGWTVRDVVAHMGSLFWEVVDPSVLPDVDGMGTERAQEVRVAERRTWSAQRVVTDYETVSRRALDALEALAQVDVTLPLGDLGTYPASAVPNAFAFDHFVHIRADLFAPRGPLARARPPVDALRTEPTLDWIEQALAQQCAGVVDALPGTARLEVTGPVPRTISIGSGGVVATVSSDAWAFVMWTTQRGSWEDLDVTADGDPDALSALRKIHVF